MKLVLIPVCTHTTQESQLLRDLRSESADPWEGGKGGLRMMQIRLEEEEEALTLEAGGWVPGAWRRRRQRRIQELVRLYRSDMMHRRREKQRSQR